MKRYVAVLISLVSSAAFAQEPAFIHGQFGFQPKGWEGAQLTESQKKDQDGCVADNAKQAKMSQEERAALESIYGFKPGQADFYGAALSGCLAGKGWIALKRNGQAWEPVTARHALRGYMGLDPAQ